MMEREMYRDCMRNHAATLGTYATDGCGEYTPDPTSPGGLRCAACGCHRNFHRKVPILSPAIDGGGDSLIIGYSPSGSVEAPEGRKRTRTKFTPEQKEEMLRFAEKIGWRIPRRDGTVGGLDEVGRFCREIGVSRQIFKVWMHNHKNSSSSSSTGGTTITAATDNDMGSAGGSMEQ